MNQIEPLSKPNRLNNQISPDCLNQQGNNIICLSIPKNLRDEILRIETSICGNNSPNMNEIIIMLLKIATSTMNETSKDIQLKRALENIDKSIKACKNAIEKIKS